jgi:hypothetical protein
MRSDLFESKDCTKGYAEWRRRFPNRHDINKKSTNKLILEFLSAYYSDPCKSSFQN